MKPTKSLQPKANPTQEKLPGRLISGISGHFFFSRSK